MHSDNECRLEYILELHELCAAIYFYDFLCEPRKRAGEIECLYDDSSLWIFNWTFQ